MKKFKRKKKSSFFFLLIRSYIVFTILIVLSLIGVLVLGYLRISGVIKPYVDKNLLMYENEIISKQYDKIPVQRIIGPDGYIQILDSSNNLVYTTSNDINQTKSYTNGELDCISDYIDSRYVNVTELTNENKEKILSVMINDSIYGSGENQIYILDKNLKVIYKNNSSNKASFTQAEFNYLTNRFSETYFVKKYKFVAKDNKNYTVLIYSKSVDEKLINRILKIAGITFLGWTALYICIILIFILWTNRKVRNPILILNKAIVDFTKGKRDKYIQYNGSKEFVEICDSFNEMSQELSYSENERKRLENEKIRMMADISHDLKSPITVLKGYAKAMQDGIVPKDEEKQYLEAIYKKADGMTELINAFYEYTKMEHPDYTLFFEKVDVAEYVREYLAEKYEELDINNVELDIDIDDSSMYANIDKMQLKRVFENIIINAVKYNKKGIKLYFKLTVINDDTIKIIIADNGLGIDDNIAKNIFEPFVFGKSNSSSGLGLAIAKKIVEAHNGTIVLTKYLTEGLNTVFEIEIPKLN